MDNPSEQTKLRVLLLEDEPTDAELVENELREAGLSFNARRVDTREAFIGALEEFKPDIVLADYMLPAFDGASAVKLVRQQHPEVPVVMVTGAVGDEKAVELLGLGARDYIIKDRLARLGPAVKRALSAEQGIRARKAVEEALRESEAKFRAVVETTSDWLWEINEQGVYIYASPRVIDLLGYTPDEIVGRTRSDLMSAEEAARVSAIFGSIAAGKKPFQLLENTCLHKDGHAIALETSGVPVFDGSGVFRGYRGIDRDITSRKQAEAVLARNARDLGERVKEIRCLYDITALLLNNQRSVAEVLDACTRRIPAGWLDPSHTCARIRLGAEAFETDNFRETDWKLAAAIPVFGMEPGLIEIFYFGEIVAGLQSPFLDEEVNLIQSISTQIAQSLERRRVEKRIQKLTRLYATLSQTNQTIVRTANREELFSGICQSAVDHGRFVMAWVGLVDDSTRMVKPICHFGNETGYLKEIGVSIDDVPSGRGPTGASIRGNCVSYVNDYTTDERTPPWREAALRRGFHGAAGVPLRFGNKVIGALTLYADEQNYFDAEQVSLLEEMAIDIGYALDNFAREAERKQAEIRLTEQLDELRRWHQATLGREMRILELKHEVNELLVQSGKAPRYSSAEADGTGHADV